MQIPFLAIFACLIAVGMTAAGGFYYYTSAPTEEHHEAEAPKVEVAKKNDVSNMSYVDFGEFIIPLIKDGRTKSYILITMTFEIEKEIAEKFDSFKPRVKDACLSALHEMSRTGQFDVNSFNIPVLKRNLLAASSNVVGVGVNDVLFGKLVRQEMM